MKKILIRDETFENLILKTIWSRDSYQNFPKKFKIGTLFSS